ncbi:DJ-1/PfpI family protein [Ulvibacterium sp.]|uniref:DJ-1/PfpI family protein n=1 Tax=Ulvibacterium sp. TaxID=2665914 RepID=UPI003BAB681D
MKQIQQLVLLCFVFFSADGNAQKNEIPKKRNVAIFLYEGVEVLDFSGPAEVFAASSVKTKEGQWTSPFNVYTVAHGSGLITSQGFLKIMPNYTIENCPTPDIIVLPGGATSKSRKNPEVIDWIRNSSERTEIFLSVCTGAFLLGDAGLLKNRKATTWYGSIERLKETFTDTEVLQNVRFVDSGKIVTTAGVSAGIDGALHIVERLISRGAALETAKYMEYDKWHPNAGYVVGEE